MMSESEQCPLCGAEAINHDIEFAAGVCADCGFVINDRDQSVESERTEATDNPEASTTTDPADEWTQVIEAQDASERNLVELLSVTETLGETLLASSDAQIRAAEIATEAWRRNILHGRNMSAGAGAAVHLACRELGYPRPARKIAEAVEIDTSTLYNTYRPLVEILAPDLDSPQPIDFIPFICDSLGLSANEISAAQDLLCDQNEDGIGNPAGIAAAAVYMTLQDQSPENAVTYREAAQVVCMTKETVWKRATELRQSGSIR